jgi:hypothetical protein
MITKVIELVIVRRAVVHCVHCPFITKETCVNFEQKAPVRDEAEEITF